MLNRNHPLLKRTFSGFTLLELSIVLIIIATIAAASFKMSQSVMDSAKQTSTTNRMNAIETALMAYRIANDRLPCPADATRLSTDQYSGVEAANNTLTNDFTCVGGTPNSPLKKAANKNCINGRARI